MKVKKWSEGKRWWLSRKFHCLFAAALRSCAFLNTFTMGTPFPCVPAAFQQRERRSHAFPLEMTSGAASGSLKLQCVAIATFSSLAKFCTHYVTLWPWPLTSWSWTCVVPRLSRGQTLYEIWARSTSPRQSCWRFHTFSPSNFRWWGTFSGRFSGVRRPNFTKLGEDIGPLLLLDNVVSAFRYLDAFANAGGWNSSGVKNEAKFRTFCPSPFEN